MHTLLRRCLLLLLCLALPFSALQSVAAQVVPCPMQASGSSQQTNPLDDCCTDHAKQCGQAGQQCQSASLLLMTLNTAPALTRSRSPLTLSNAEILPVQSINGVWRPPRH